MPYKPFTNATLINGYYGPVGSRTSTALNSALVLLTSGAAVGVRFNARELTAITDLYLYITSFTGTKANVTMQCRVLSENTAQQPTRPANNVLATSSATTLPAGASGWVRFTFSTPYTPSNIGEVLWMVVDNTSSVPATDFPNILSNLNVVFSTQNYSTCFSTAGGFSTNGTQLPRFPYVVTQGGSSFGIPFTNVINNPVSSTTLKRGIIVTPDADTTLIAWEFNTSVTAAVLSGISIWESTQLPDDTAIYSFTTGQTRRTSTEAVPQAISFEPPFTMRRGRTYYVCYTLSAVSTSPSSLIIEDYAAYSSVFDNTYDNFTTTPLVRDNGSNSWVLERNYCPRVQLTFGDQPPLTLTSEA